MLDARLDAAGGLEELDPAPDADGVRDGRPGGRLPRLRERPRTSSGGAASASSGNSPRGRNLALASDICGLTNEDVIVMAHAAANAETASELLGDRERSDTSLCWIFSPLVLLLVLLRLDGALLQ